jgi:hypothetical protein
MGLSEQRGGRAGQESFVEGLGCQRLSGNFSIWLRTY